VTAPKVRPKWRPSLTMIVVAVLLAVACLPAAVVIAFRSVEGASARIGPVEVGAMGAALVLTLVVALVLARAVTGPIHALVTRSREIASGGRAAIRPLDRYGTQELATLSQSFLDLASQLVERTEYVQTLAAHMSHELKSPLTAIKGAAELLRDCDGPGEEMSRAERQRFLGHIIAETERLDALVGRLRDLAGAEMAPAEGQMNLAGVADALRQRHPDLAIELDAAGDLPLPAETAEIVFGHLADNARQHGATRLRLSAQASVGTVTILVADDGPGISPANRGRIFDPFFTTRRESGGTGMGLQIVRALLRSSGGDIALAEAEGGTTFRLSFRRPGDPA